jgi:hypothetical protein
MKLFCGIIQILHNNNQIIDPILSIITTMFYNIYIDNTIEFTIQNKFNYLETVLNNQNLFVNTKEQFICVFCKTQKIYWILSRFFRKFLLFVKNRKMKSCYEIPPPYYNTLLVI